MKVSPVKLNFNKETFIDELKHFKEYTKPEFEKKKKTGELKLHPEAVLGIFPQAGSYLVPDYQQLIEEDRHEDIEDFFASRTSKEVYEREKHSPEYFYFLNKVK